MKNLRYLLVLFICTMSFALAQVNLDLHKQYFVTALEGATTACPAELGDFAAEQCAILNGIENPVMFMAMFDYVITNMHGAPYMAFGDWEEGNGAITKGYVLRDGSHMLAASWAYADSGLSFLTLAWLEL